MFYFKQKLNVAVTCCFIAVELLTIIEIIPFIGASNGYRQRTLSESFFPDLTSPSPPRFVSLEDIISAANGMANMALAHEIAVDSTFQLEKQDPPPNRYIRRVAFRLTLKIIVALVYFFIVYKTEFSDLQSLKHTNNTTHTLYTYCFLK